MKLVALALFGQLLLVTIVGAQQSCSSNSQCSSIQSCDVTARSCINKTCTTDSACTTADTNSFCNATKCACKAGYTVLNGVCTKVHGRVCLDSQADCNPPYAICDSDTSSCKCGPEWYENNGVCTSVVGKNCSSISDCKGTDAGGSSGYVGYSSNYYNSYFKCTAAGTCTCKEGYRSVDGVCTRILWTACTNDPTICEDLENAVCDKSWSGSTYKYCKCKNGTVSTQSSTCIKKIGGACDKVYCYGYGYGSSSDKTFCNEDFVCQCKAGMVEDTTSYSCVKAKGRICSKSTDCGGSVAFACVQGVCTCATGFRSATDTDIGEICEPVLGNQKKDSSDNDCSAVANAAYDSQGVCKCDPGFFQANGTCVKVLGAFCCWDRICHGTLNHTRCGTSSKCECSTGYQQQGNVCVKIPRPTCMADSGCSSPYSTCTDGYCACSSGLVELNGQCLRQACAEPIDELHDWERRSIYERVDTEWSSEPSLSDYVLSPNKWYSIGPNQLAWASTDSSIGPTQGSGSTARSIHLTGPLSAEELQAMETGEEIDKQVFVAAADTGETRTTMDIKLRKCGDRTDLYAAKPLSWDAAYTFVGRNTCQRKTYKSWNSYYSLTTSSLEFNRITKADGTEWYTPSLKFTAQDVLSDKDKDKTYLLSWYGNGRLLAEFGPKSGSSGIDSMINESALTEDVLLANGFKAGVAIQYSIRMLASFNSSIHWDWWSPPLMTGLQSSGKKYVHHGVGNPYPQRDQHTGIGCETPVTSTDLSCQLRFKTKNSTCGSGTSSIDPTNHHPSCGWALMGLTELGSKQSWSSPYYQTDANGAYSTFGSYAFTPDSGGSPSPKWWHVDMELDGNTGNTGHPFWMDYEPSFDFWYQSTGSSNYFSCYLYQSGYIHNIPTMNRYSSGTTGYVYADLTLDKEGVYDVLYDPINYLHVQLEIEKSTDADIGETFRICGLTIRHRDDIWTKSSCGGTSRYEYLQKDEGGPLSPPSDFSLTDSPYDYWYHEEPFNIGIYSNVLSSEDSSNMGGLCSADSTNYLLKNGQTTSSAAEFVGDWRTADSLSSSANRVGKANTKEFYKCGCPHKDETIEEKVSTSSSGNRYYEYIGVLKCSQEDKCTKEYEGPAWPPTLSTEAPDYQIEDVAVSAEINPKSGVPDVIYSCGFQPSAVMSNYYAIKWYLDGSLVTTSRRLTGSEVLEYELSILDLIAADITIATKFKLDSDIECSVSVFDVLEGGAPLLEDVMSPPWNLVEVPEPVINMLKGGEAQLNLDLKAGLLTTNNIDMFFEVLVFDFDDEDNVCRGASFAVRLKNGGNICGAEIAGRVKVEGVVFTSERLEIILVQKCNYNYDIKEVYTLGLKVSIRIGPNRYFSIELKQRITCSLSTTPIGIHRLCVLFGGSCYRVPGNESLLNTTYVNSLANTVTEDHTLCSCSRSSPDPICAVNEADTCSIPLEIAGVDLFSEQNRKRRSVSPLILESIARDIQKEPRTLIKRSTPDMDMETAMTQCQEALNKSCPMYKRKDTVQSVSKDGAVVTCALDMQIDSSIPWSNETCKEVTINVMAVTEKNITYQTNSPTAAAEVGKSCPGDCNGNGKCNSNGVCECNEDFGDKDCIISKKVPPQFIQELLQNVCDKKTEGNCVCLNFTTDGNTEDVVCRIIISTAYAQNNNGQNKYVFTQVREITVQAVVIDLNELECCIPNNIRRKRSTGVQDAEVGQGFEISLSNDNSTFGNSSSVYVLDSSCQELVNDTDGNYQLVLKSGYCYIDGTCYAESVTSGALNCSICDPATDVFNWKENCNATASPSSSDDDETKFIIICSAVGAGALVICIGTLVAVKMLMTKKKIIAPDLMLYDTSRLPNANKRFAMRKDTAMHAWM